MMHIMRSPASSANGAFLLTTEGTMAATLASPLASRAAPSLASTSGPILLGTVFGSMLYGLVLFQTYRYYRLYPKDRIELKTLVFIIALMETIHTALWILVCYEYFIVNFFNPFSLHETRWYVQLTVPFTGLIPIVAQIFYACRLYYLRTEFKYRLIVAVTVVIMLSDLGWDLANTVLVFHAKDLTEFSRSTWLVSVSSAHLVVGDAIIAATLIYILRKSRTGFSRTDTVLDLLIIYTINSGILITVFSLSTFIFVGTPRPKQLDLRRHQHRWGQTVLQLSNGYAQLSPTPVFADDGGV
ncbi:hypothetical protein PYCCODRAFT_1415528 [Trametes coccinea BRFM310]|uniref:DUF6534 domain-containing protein n=1 Tax=Trametes coccinea (strain BRFM310) TaxID=1353009 RepID=A0A1Y2IG16_TRAC3|nr:hypothetical protein PYCCODRAFT_1415528 [Trametes coccinea BRFM310]